MDSFLKKEELLKMGFSNVGDHVLISRFVKFYNANKIAIGSNVRIDVFCVLSGKIDIGNNVHISSSTLLYAGNVGIIINNNVNISS